MSREAFQFFLMILKIFDSHRTGLSYTNTAKMLRIAIVLLFDAGLQLCVFMCVFGHYFPRVFGRVAGAVVYLSLDTRDSLRNGRDARDVVSAGIDGK